MLRRRLARSVEIVRIAATASLAVLRRTATIARRSAATVPVARVAGSAAMAMPETGWASSGAAIAAAAGAPRSP
jgi:hypothetical protein